MHRRTLLGGGLAALALARSGLSLAAEPAALVSVAQSPWLTNGVTLTPDGAMFINFPRFKGHENSPALARVVAGQPQPFPGNAWNRWRPGDSGQNRLVNVNAVHCFGDSLIWAVDQGAPQGEKAPPGAAKLVAFDAQSGAVRKLIRFNSDVLPAGGAPNDLRMYQDLIVITDSGLGGIILHDLETGYQLRRLSQVAELRKPAGAQQKGFHGRILQDGAGNGPAVHSDMLEISPDGEWLYVATPTGPLWRIKTAALLNKTLDDSALRKQLEKVAAIPSVGGSAIDAHGRILLANSEARAVDLLLPDGRRRTLVQDARLNSPDALFIHNGYLYIPAPQIEDLKAHAGGTEKTRAPWHIWRYPLPAALV